MRRFLRLTGVFAAMTAVLVMTAGTAAAEVAEFRAEADANGILVRVFDQAEVGGALSDATVTSAPEATAEGVGLTAVDATHTEVSLTSGSTREPESGRACALPDLSIPGLTLAAGCSFASADAGAPSAASEGALGEVAVDGTLLTELVGAVVDLVLQPTVDAVDTAISSVDDLSGPVLDPVIDQLRVECNALLAEIDDPSDEIPDISEESPEELAPVLDAADDAVDAVGETFPQACTILANLVTTPPSLGDVPTAVEEALRGALEGGRLIDVALGTTDSSTTTTADSVVAQSQAVGAGITLPSLDYLAGAVTAAIEGLTQALVDEVAQEVEPLEGIDVPGVDEVLQPILDELDLPDVLSAEDPLLDLTVADSRARVSLDRASGDTSATTSAGTVVIRLSEAFATLVGEDNTRIEVGPGVNQTVLAGTPLETTVAVGATEVTPETTESGLSGRAARALGVLIDVGTGLPGGGLGVEIATVRAAAFGAEPEVGAAPPPAVDEPALPSTGGGLALAGLLAVLGAVLLRRRD